jgi:ABC-2 type transport system permease protein
MTFAASLRKELMELWRTRRFLVMAVVLVSFGMTSPLLAKYTPQMMELIPGGEAFVGLIPEPTLMDAVTQYVKNTNQFAILLALLLSMGAVALEKERGTAAMMLVKPLPRWDFLLAKFAALSLGFLACILLAGIFAYYYTLFLFEAPDLGAWLVLTLFLWLSAVVYIAITLLFSTLFRSQAAAAGLAVGVILFFALLGVSPQIARVLPGELVNWGASLFTPQPSPAWASLGLSLGLIVASLVGAWAAFRRQEL